MTKFFLFYFVGFELSIGQSEVTLQVLDFFEFRVKLFILFFVSFDLVIQDFSEGGEFFVVQFDEEGVEVDIVFVILYIDDSDF